MTSHVPLSQHAIDVRIRALSNPSAQMTADDVDAIVGHVAVAPFSSKRWSVPAHLRINFHGTRIGTTAKSALYHALKRIVQDRQWSPATTLDA